MKIGFIGGGKVGFSLGKYFLVNGYEISGYFSRSIQSARHAAEFTNSLCFDDLRKLVEVSDIVFLTVNDDAIESVWKELLKCHIKNKIICHCSGVLSSEVFSGADGLGAYFCSVHPMTPISGGEHSYKNLKDAFFTIEGDEYARGVIKKILENIGNEYMIIENPKNKPLYHLACVFESNFITAVFNMGVELFMKCGFNYNEACSAAYRLINGNIDNLRHDGVDNSLTGPAVRGDVSTVMKHMSLLKGDDLLIYKLLSKKLVDIAETENTDDVYDALKKILEG